MNEALRKAVQDVLVHLHDTPTTGYIRDNDASRDAIAALKAIMAQQEQPGWQLVPVEPTEAMLSAGYDSGLRDSDAWAAMLAAAPKGGKP